MPGTMRARRLQKAGVMPEIVEFSIPEPGRGQLRRCIAGSGLWHSDLPGIHAEPAVFSLPLTIGHEPSG